jgi:SWI/SNF-related matrix-associated actin-dependent regulator of chromatin subfamily A3
VASRASCDLIADRRLCLTGTPVQNKLDDVFALIKFLRLQPLDDKNTWTEYIGTPVKYGQSLGVVRLQTVMKCITLRRTKDQTTANGKKLLALPPRRDEIRYLRFAEGEKAIYDAYFTESRNEFNELSHRNEVMKNYVGILQKILRLRQICDHYELVQNKGSCNSQFDGATHEDITAAIARDGIDASRAAAIFNLLRESATAQCVECGIELATVTETNQSETSNEDPPKRGRKPKVVQSKSRAGSPIAIVPVLTKCQHLFCIACYRNCICPGWPEVPPDATRCCSACPTGLRPSDAVEIRSDTSVSEPKKRGTKKEKRPKGQSIANYASSTKIDTLMMDLVTFSKSNPYSTNFDPSSVEIQELDSSRNVVSEEPIKTVVL